MSESAAIHELTFEAGYDRLQAIAARLNDDEVPVSEMCDLFAEGKGLERALTAYLETQRERVEAIERGEGLRAFRIAGTSLADHGVTRPPVTEQPAAAVNGVTALLGDDEIPF